MFPILKCAILVHTLFDEDFFPQSKALKYYCETENYASRLCEVKPNKLNKRTLSERGEKVEIY